MALGRPPAKQTMTGAAPTALDAVRGDLRAACELALRSPVSAALGLAVEADGTEDSVRVLLPASAALAGRDGHLHGGTLPILVDTASGLVAGCRVGANATLDLRVDQMRPLSCAADVVVRVADVGGQAPLVTVRSEILQRGSDAPAATAVATFIQTRRPHVADDPALRRVAETPGNAPRGDDAFFGWLGAVADGTDKATYHLPFSARVLSSWEIMQAHGGVVAGYLEAAALQALHMLHGVKARTIDVTTSYLRPADAQTLHARVEVLRISRRIAVVRVSAWQQHLDQPAAQLLGHFQILA